MVFHLGAVIRLNEASLLPKLSRISTVSGGSILGAWMGLRWSKLNFGASGVATNLKSVIVNPIRKMASTTIDESSVIGGILAIGKTINEEVVEAYEEHLYEKHTLQAFPDHPQFVINATNVQSGVLMRFSRPYLWDYRVGKIEHPEVRLSQAVGASSAFPPVLSPARLDLSAQTWVPGSGDDLQKRPYTSNVFLTDGGVYDNLGLETAWKRYRTIFVSDGGGQMKPDPKPDQDWIRHSLRVSSIVDNQVRSLRKRQLISSYDDESRTGAYWGIRSDIRKFPAKGKLSAPHAKTLKLADMRTRLRKISDEDQRRLINWGYAITDASIRAHYAPTHDLDPGAFPYPGGVG